MARRAMSLCVLALIAAASGPAGADWNTGDPYKWVQYPDLSTYGMDINATAVESGEPRIVLADDFLCTARTLITDIHVWGSWRYDRLPFGWDPGAVTFMVAILSDIPASESPTGYSMPGNVLWTREFAPGSFEVRQWAVGLQEWWWGPQEAPIFPGDSVCWQYNFQIPPPDAFLQQGTPTAPVVYWLALHARPEDLISVPPVRFGWKTSPDHWNDAAVWNWLPSGGYWQPMFYPPPHPLAGQQIDLAFVITELGGTDWGDAPDPPYPTLSGASNGANHTIVPGVYLGQTVDSEGNGQPDANALGDDLSGVDDEDGITFLSPLVPGTWAQVQVEASTPGYLSGWVDFNGDGFWLSSQGDWILTGQYIPAGTSTVSFLVPSAATPGIQTFARFRFTTQAWTAWPSGPAPDGEVEDYAVVISHPQTSDKWIQYPDLRESGIDINVSHDRALADDFLCTSPGRVTQIRIWGSWLGDWLPWGSDPEAVGFRLSIRADIPAWESPTGYSMPGELLWTRYFMAGGPSGFVAEEWFNAPEGWFDPYPPPGSYQFPADWTCWRYTFRIPGPLAFHQVGMPDRPIVYWLEVQAYPDDPEALFGWKASVDHWNDDAVWALLPNPAWFELVYPPGHPFAGESIDLAFSIYCGYGTDVPEGGEPAQVIPERFGLRQNVPNPFNPVTAIGYDVPAGGGRVTLEVFDVSGRLVRTLVDGFVSEGVRSASWDGRDGEGKEVGSGVYFCRMKAGETEQTVKMTLLK
ncbi:MAG: hypothetical protein FJY74_05270 [Candidatus Eisenbacteria bacterium]|nr:hypothetical protein [Candidatus Eisenbacteria bacterium]